MHFNFSVFHIPGENPIIASALSKSPVSIPNQGDILTQGVDAFVYQVVTYCSASN